MVANLFRFHSLPGCVPRAARKNGLCDSIYRRKQVLKLWSLEIQALFLAKKNPKSEMSDVDIVPLFISIDVRRDTFEEINEYCEVIAEIFSFNAK